MPEGYEKTEWGDLVFRVVPRFASVGLASRHRAAPGGDGLVCSQVL